MSSSVMETLDLASSCHQADGVESNILLSDLQPLAEKPEVTDGIVEFTASNKKSEIVFSGQETPDTIGVFY